MRLSDVEAAQATIVQTALQLEADGKIVIATPAAMIGRLIIKRQADDCPYL